MLVLKGIQKMADTFRTTFLGVAIGTGTTAATVNDNALETESQRVASTNVLKTTTVSNDTSQHTGDITISATTIALTEAAVMTTSTTGGDCAARQVFSVMNFVQNDNVVLVFKFVCSG